jgi:Sodium/calcium exchanger protein
MANFSLIAVGTLLPYLGGQFLVRNAAPLAITTGMSCVAIGLTVVPFGTSNPELASTPLPPVRAERAEAEGGLGSEAGVRRVLREAPEGRSEGAVFASPPNSVGSVYSPDYLGERLPEAHRCVAFYCTRRRGAPAPLRIVQPTSPAIREAAKIPSLAVFRNVLSAKARSEMNRDIVKPMPASHPAP